MAVLGLGHAGAATVAWLLRDGHAVLAVDPDPVRRAIVSRGTPPSSEPGVAELLAVGRRSGRLAVAASLPAAALDRLGTVLVCVGTPAMAQEGEAAGPLDLRQIRAATAALAAGLGRRMPSHPPLLLAYRSTLPPGTLDGLILPMLATAGPPGRAYEVAALPEFLREGSALADTLAPSRMILGERCLGATAQLGGLLTGLTAPILEVSYAVAELVKLADNSWHATKIAFANELGRLAVAHGVAPAALAAAFLADTRLNLGPAYLRPGLAFGGACLLKDLAATVVAGHAHGLDLPVLEAVAASNVRHLDWLVRMIADRIPPPGPLLQLGLAFKPGTDDLRLSPLVALASRLLARGFELWIVDDTLDRCRLANAIAAAAPAAVLARVTGLAAALARRPRMVLSGVPLPPAGLPPALPVLDLYRLGLC